MKALWLEGRRLSLRGDVPRPEVIPGEAVVRVLLAGICTTDLELVRGYYPYAGIPGHEFVGQVVEGAGDLVGQRVVGEINASCEACPTCSAGRRRHCPNRTVLGIVGRHGALAEYLRLPVRNLHPIPTALSDEAAVFTEPLAAALRIQEQLALGPGIRVLVAGDGKLGLLVAQVLALSGCELEAAGHHDAKLEILRRSGIATVTEVTEGAYDVAVECTGNPGGYEMARRALRPGGKLVMKSTYAGRLSLDVAALVVDEIELVGSRCGPFAPALKLLEQGVVDVIPLIEARFGLSDAVAAMERAGARGALKVLVEVAGT